MGLYVYKNTCNHHYIFKSSIVSISTCTNFLPEWMTTVQLNVSTKYTNLVHSTLFRHINNVKSTSPSYPLNTNKMSLVFEILNVLKRQLMYFLHCYVGKQLEQKQSPCELKRQKCTNYLFMNVYLGMSKN